MDPLECRVPIGQGKNRLVGDVCDADEADAFFEGQEEAPRMAGNDIDDLLPTTVSQPQTRRFNVLMTLAKRAHLKPVKAPRRPAKRVVQKRDCAHVIDINTPLSNFHELVPEMAHKVP